MKARHPQCVPSYRLLRLTAPTAAPTHFVAAEVAFGEQLHPGKLFNWLTNEQHWILVREFRISGVVEHRYLLDTLVEIDEGYYTFAELDRRNGAIGQHKLRLASIARLAKKLRPLIDNEPLMWHFEEKSSSLYINSVVKALWYIEQTARALSEDDSYLNRVRVSKNPPPGKTSERFYIWEPIVRLWIKLGHSLGYSEDGPIIRVLRHIHEGLTIDPPKPGAVRQMIDDLKGRRRSPRKPSCST